MQTKVEGILLNKLPYRERDFIAKLLLRNGKTISVRFPGGQGGGKKKKSSIIEIGFVMSLELVHARETSEMFIAREWVPLWVHHAIRDDYKAFCLLCLYVEIIARLGGSAYLHQSGGNLDREQEGLFRVLGNAIFYLEDACQKKNLLIPTHLLVFSSKLIVETGFYPNLHHCAICQQKMDHHHFILSNSEGGVVCGECAQESSEIFEELVAGLAYVATTKSSEIDYARPFSAASSSRILNYALHHLHLDDGKIRTLEAVL